MKSLFSFSLKRTNAQGNQFEDELILELLIKYKGNVGLLIHASEEIELILKKQFKRTFKKSETPDIYSVIHSLVTKLSVDVSCATAEKLASEYNVSLPKALEEVMKSDDGSLSKEEDSGTFSSVKSKDNNYSNSLNFDFQLSKNGQHDRKITDLARSFIDSYSKIKPKFNSLSIPPFDQPEFHSLISKMINLSQSKDDYKAEFTNIDSALNKNIDTLRKIVVKKVITKTIENQKLGNLMEELGKKVPQSVLGRKRLSN